MLELLTNQVILEWEWSVRILVAAVLGAMIGFERKNRNKIAGVRTHAIVALGAALMMVVSKYGFYDMAEYDASRVAAQIVSGVGFLGAGIIFVRNNSSVSGLTTVSYTHLKFPCGSYKMGYHMLHVFQSILFEYVHFPTDILKPY